MTGKMNRRITTSLKPDQRHEMFDQRVHVESLFFFCKVSDSQQAYQDIMGRADRRLFTAVVINFKDFTNSCAHERRSQCSPFPRSPR